MTRLPWTTDCPLMLAPMQGVTNRALREVYGMLAKPDVLFTEFVRVRPGAKKVIADADFVEATTRVSGIPLIVQVIGCADEGVVDAVRDLVARGVRHINVNMGCPFGRMTSVLAGGGMFRYPETVYPMLASLREIVPGSLSVKTRLGIDEPREIFAVLDAFEKASIDFLIVHSRTVRQKYRGSADHDLSREIVEAMKMPVIANGDIRTTIDANAVLAHTNAAGLMLGRGAIADHRLFDRVRGDAPADTSIEERTDEARDRLRLLFTRYQQLFCGETQVMMKFREVVSHLDDEFTPQLKKRLRRAKTATAIERALKNA